jgi:hypothetical protein
MMVRLSTGSRLVHGDISLTGLGFELPGSASISKGDLIEVRLALPDQMITVRARVTRIRRVQPRAIGKIFIGASIVGMDELSANPLFRFVEESELLERAARPTSVL